VTTDHHSRRIRWRWGFAVAFAMMMVALFPQIYFAVNRGHDWQGSNAVSHPDEVAYSAYVASLIRGNPRRYDPYAGRGAEAGAAESLFSIQLIPAYTVALPGRWFRMSASTLFMLFPVLCALASSLALFWFLSLLTRDDRFSAGAVVFVLCLGTLIARQGIVRYVPNLNYLIPMWLSERVLPASAYHLPFLRLYQPAVAFPLFFVLCVFVWLALNNSTGRRSVLYAAAAGVSFLVLVFSYFYLWTAAAAWLACLGFLWLVFRRAEFRRLMLVFGIIGAFALAALSGYYKMLSHRAATVDSAQALVFTHRPDLFRLSEVASLMVLVILAIGARRRGFRLREPKVLFTASLALMVFAVFNQQIFTGRSLQPIHYEWFIGNYCALAAIVLVSAFWWRDHASGWLTNKRVAAIACFAFVWGLSEVWLAASVNYDRNRAADEFKPVAERLTSLAQTDNALRSGRTGPEVPAVLVSDLPLADRLPTDAPQPVLWAPRMLVFPGVSEAEDRERFWQQLYYLGYDEHKIWKDLDKADWNFYVGLFPYYRLSRVVSGSTSPITVDELRVRVRDYLAYIKSFDRRRASSPTLSCVVVHAGDETDFANLDRWYQRDAGERVGDFILYRLKLRE
jgi:hypothetical protein